MPNRWRPALSLATLLSLLLAALALQPRRSAAAPPTQEATPPPKTVTIPGTIQSVLGCPADWQPGCDTTFLTYDAAADVWAATFDLPAGEYEYKAALNGTWDENYGLGARRGGANIPLKLAAPAKVTFLYDHKTHWVTDSLNSPIALVVGDLQPALGCASNQATDCFATWLQDPNATGTASFTTTTLPAGTYSAQVALDQGRAGIFGADGAKDGAPISFTVKNDGDEIYFGFDTATNRLTISVDGAPRGDIGKAAAYWVSKDTIIWNVLGSPKYRYALHYDPEGALTLEPSGIKGGKELALTFSPAGPGAALKQFPHLAGFSALKLATDDLALLPDLLRSQLAITVRNEQGKLVDSTALQIPGVLDDLYRYDGPLGVSWDADTPTLRLWAPTARAVALHRFADSRPQTVAEVTPMTRDTTTGVWSISGAPAWKDSFYLYAVEVYVPGTGKVERNLVTDPYALSLAINSSRSQIVNLADPALAPANWATLAKPALASFSDIVLYELHVRDFSIADSSVPAAERGTFAAFARSDSNGMQHLKRLAEAGLTHVHLLPVFDIATIEEDPTKRQEPDRTRLASFAADADAQQALIEPLRDKDGFNWGYDPWHYSVPEGSYSTAPDGSARIREFRQMVAGLNTSGLRVVMDVVYNHTNASGQNQRSVLDRIVPGYYHRLDATGAVATSTCCQNTASEHAMMEKLLIDSVITWATAYKVDGFRFDLMGHHMKSNMVKLRQALDKLTPERDGVDGTKIYLYGEGWNFGEVENGKRGENATQLNMAGSGIGTFNDRLRDAVRGGGPFSGFQEQGFASGLLSSPNPTETRPPDVQRARLLEYGDWIKVGLAGNLKTYRLTDREGRAVTGEQVTYNGAPAGYTASPTEQIVYVSAHDNETLFDAIQAKAAPATRLADRIRMHNLALSIVAFSQGVAFFHAGDDLLRSKSLDRDSYNSGDWYNAIDWSFNTNNWGIGLPPAGSNQEKWPLIKPLLADPGLKPSKPQIEAAAASFREWLQIRKSSPLFHLSSAEQIQAQVGFYNNGPEQTPGLIVMELRAAGENSGPYQRIVVLFNGNSQPTTFADPGLANGAFTLHPIQASGQDAVVKTATYDTAQGGFRIPAYTTAVFVSEQAAVTTQNLASPTSDLVPPTSDPTAATNAVVAQPASSPTAERPLAPTATNAPATGVSLWLWVGLAVVVVLVGLGLLARRRR